MASHRHEYEHLSETHDPSETKLILFDYLQHKFFLGAGRVSCPVTQTRMISVSCLQFEHVQLLRVHRDKTMQSPEREGRRHRLGLRDIVARETQRLLVRVRVRLHLQELDDAVEETSRVLIGEEKHSERMMKLPWYTGGERGLASNTVAIDFVALRYWLE